MLAKADGCFIPIKTNFNVIDADLKLARLVDTLRSLIFPALACHTVGCLEFVCIEGKIAFDILALPSLDPCLKHLVDFSVVSGSG